MADIAGTNGQRTEFKVVGRPNIPGRLSYSLATGEAKFGSDVAVPNMLHAKFLRSPYSRAKIKSMDTGKAKALAGVVDIVTWDDPDIKNMPAGREVPLLTNQSDSEDEEIGAIVVAESPELCDEALKLLKVEWDVLPHVLDPREGVKPEAPVIRINPKGTGNVTVTNFAEGDVEAGFKEADQIVEFDWLTAFLAGHTPNPHGSVSWWYKDPVGAQGPTLFIEGISPTWGGFQLRPMYNLTFDKIYRNTTYQGGKYCDWRLRRAALITPLLARRTGRPVRCVNIRENDYDPSHPLRYMHAKIGFKNDGRITAVHETGVGTGGIEARFSPFNTTRCVHLKTDYQGVATNTGRTSGGQVSPVNWDVLTVAEQIVADRLGMDVIDVALNNIHGPASQTDPGIPPSFQQCIEKGKKAMNWQWHPAGAKKLPDGRMHGLAFRYGMSPRHAFESYTMTVTIQGDGKVYIPLKGPWMGVYAADACAMVVAEELGAKIEDVILSYDPKALFTPVGGGSDGTSASAWVAKEAAVACKKLLLEIAAPKFKAKPEDLDTRDSTVFLKSDPAQSFPFRTFPEADGSGDHDQDIAATFTGKPPITTWMTDRGKILETMNVTFCEVAVDTETGETEVTKYLVVCDPGKVLRPTSFEGQIHQAMFFSHGAGLTEEFIYDKTTGVKLHTNMLEYKKPTMLDVGPVEVHAVETRSGNACYGGSGISHCMASSQLVVCAIANAIGKWIMAPATPDKVLKALGKA